FSVANAGGGTAAVAGNIVAGLHQITVLFKDREGYLTRYAPPGLWTAGGLKRVTVSNIPIGPPNIVARILAFTLVAGNNFYYLSGVPQIGSSNFVINDDTTTSITVDFNDAILAAGTNVDNQLNLIYLGETAGLASYSDRLFTWGGVNKINNMLNLSFDGGLATSLPRLPERCQTFRWDGWWMAHSAPEAHLAWYKAIPW